MQPCFWIIEGFASWMEEARFDLERGVIQTFNPRCEDLDILASLVDAKAPRIDWKDLFSFTQIQFARIPREPERGFVAESHRRLGALHQLSWTRLRTLDIARCRNDRMIASAFCEDCCTRGPRAKRSRPSA